MYRAGGVFGLWAGGKTEQVIDSLSVKLAPFMSFHGKQGSLVERRRWPEMQYITMRHGAEAHNGMLIKKSILGRAGLHGALQKRVKVGVLSAEAGKAALSAA